MYIGDDLQYTSVLALSAVLAGVLLMLFFAWNVSQTFEELGMKQNVMIHRV